MGPSGSGKSTLIRCLNRLEEHQAGSINVQGIEINNDLKNIDEIRRDVGMVFPAFQSVSAFDHSGKLHASPYLGTENAKGGGRRNRDEISNARENSRTGEINIRASFQVASNSV